MRTREPLAAGPMPLDYARRSVSPRVYFAPYGGPLPIEAVSLEGLADLGKKKKGGGIFGKKGIFGTKGFIVQAHTGFGLFEKKRKKKKPTVMTREAAQAIITKAYQELLGRYPEPGAFLDPILTGTMTEDQLREEIKGSDEYQARQQRLNPIAPTAYPSAPMPAAAPMDQLAPAASGAGATVQTAQQLAPEEEIAAAGFAGPPRAAAGGQTWLWLAALGLGGYLLWSMQTQGPKLRARARRANGPEGF